MRPANAAATADGSRPSLIDLWPLALGIAALLLPTYLRLYQGVWQQEAYEHGPIIVAVFWWLLWRCRDRLAALPREPELMWGTASIAAGLFVYYVGRSQNLPLFEVAAQVPLFAGVALYVFGWGAARVLWFPLLFLVFLAPLPGFIIVGVTGQLKQVVSASAETLLYWAGYPVARDGVVITIGQYQMLVADACSGLNSMYSLSAMGLLYVYLMQRTGWIRNAILLAFVLPIAFVANVVRVIILILLTYHFGDEVGQGFLHNAAGMVLFVVSLTAMLCIDILLGRLAALRRPRGGDPASS